MKEVELALQAIGGYLISISRNTVEGWYELEIGLPNSWVFDENSKISCEVLTENEAGKLILIAPKSSDIVIDDLIDFVEIILETNKKIAEKEKEFTNSMEEMRGLLEEKAKKFYEELDDLKESSFKKIGGDFAKTLGTKSKRGRPRGSINKKTPTVTEETEVIDSKE